MSLKCKFYHFLQKYNINKNMKTIGTKKILLFQKNFPNIANLHKYNFHYFKSQNVGDQ